MSGRIPTRETDEMVLAWLKMRSVGISSTDIATHYGVTNEKVRVATNRVVKADVLLCGSDVLADYWLGARA